MLTLLGIIGFCVLWIAAGCLTMYVIYKIITPKEDKDREVVYVKDLPPLIGWVVFWPFTIFVSSIMLISIKSRDWYDKNKNKRVL